MGHLGRVSGIKHLVWGVKQCSPGLGVAKLCKRGTLPESLKGRVHVPRVPPVPLSMSAVTMST